MELLNQLIHIQESLLRTETVLTFMLFVGFVGFGVFIERRLWPWFVTYMDTAQEHAQEVKMRQIDLLEQGEIRWRRTAEKIEVTLEELIKQLTIIGTRLERPDRDRN